MATADAADQEKGGTEERFEFQAEVARLLDIVAHSLYSTREVFLRELISNASDACERLRYAALTQPELVAGDAEYGITLSVDPRVRTLTISDNGSGMNRDDLVDSLGTIARSGTAAFIEKLGEEAGALEQIGQFGVGFYSAFMVADRVVVETRHAGEDVAWRWESDGQGAYTISEGSRETRGTDVILQLRKDAKEYLEGDRLREIVRRYSDHIAFPVRLAGKEGISETLNAASALWMRPRKEIREEDYTEFYRHVGHAFDEPWMTLHWRAEGKSEYTGLLFVPSAKPFDLFHPERRHGVKLYVRRIFITDDCEDLVPGWLRFLKGVVDSEDLPLNISREMLQNNPMLGKIRNALVRRVLGELKKKSERSPEEFSVFWENFGAVLKEGLYEEPDRRDDILALARFRSTSAFGLTTLADYVGRMKDGQEKIYYINGEDAEALAGSPQIEGFEARGVEVLLLTDPVDQFWIPAVPDFEGKPFASVTRGGADLSGIATAGDEDPAKTGDGAAAGADNIVALLKIVLGDAVSDVRVSGRLTGSAVCLVADEAGPDMHLERLLKEHGRLDMISARVLEINPDHPLIARLDGLAGDDGAADRLADAAWLLLDQARIIEGEGAADPAAFSRRLSKMMEGAF